MNEGDNNKYKDIIHLPHHVSKLHKQMSLYERAAQFSPFAALTGYEEVLAMEEQSQQREIFLRDTPKQLDI